MKKDIEKGMVLIKESIKKLLNNFNAEEKDLFEKVKKGELVICPTMGFLTKDQVKLLNYLANNPVNNMKDDEELIRLYNKVFIHNPFPI